MGEIPYMDRSMFLYQNYHRIGLLKVVEFTINLSDSSPLPLLEKSVDPLFISFVSSLLAFSQTIEATTLAQLTFSPFSYAI